METRLPPHLVQRFRDAYCADYGVELSDEEAEEISNRVVNFIFFIARLNGKRGTPESTKVPSDSASRT